MLRFRRHIQKQTCETTEFHHLESHNPYEILDVLDRNALPSLRTVFADGAGPTIERLRRRLTAIGLFHGSRDGLKAVLFDRLDKAFCRDDFHVFRLTMNPDGAYLELEMLHRAAVATIRIWRGQHTFFAVGDSEFEATNERCLQEVLAQKLGSSQA